MIYLDNAATSAQKPLSVIFRFWKETLTTSVNAGRGAHRLSIRALEGINSAAESLAGLFNIDDPSRIAFLPNATYALNLGILGALKPGDNVIVTSMDHNSVLRPAALWGDFTIVAADAEGYVNPQDIESAIKSNTALIVCSHVSNVCGTVQNIEEISAIAGKYEIPFLLDAAQSAGCMDIDAKKLGVDMIAFSGHKGLLGPLGTGGLYVSPQMSLSPVITGGTGSMSESLFQPDFMPDMLQSGTMNTPAVIALGAAAEIVKDTSEIYERERELAVKFIADLKNMPGVRVFGRADGERNGAVAFNVFGRDCSEIEELLDRRYGIIVRAGYHCAPLAHKTIGSGDTGAVRVSFGFYSTDRHRKAASDAVYQIIKRGF